MKRIPLIFVFAIVTFLMGCQEKSSKKKNSNQNQNAYCTTYPNSYGCPNYCQNNPNGYGCSGTTTGSTTGTTTGGSTTGTTGSTTGGTVTNPYPNYGSSYTDKNWQVKYPYVPSLNCSDPVAPSGIDYTPYDTRKGTVTVIGAGFGTGKNPADPKAWYDPNTYIPLASGDSTSERLRTLVGAKQFFWTDSTLKVRFKANLQPDSSQGNPICYGRVTNMSWIKGYSRLKFNLYLVGTKEDNTTTEEFLGEQTIDINKCSSAINLSSFNGINYPSKYPNGIYLKIKNVRGNQNWSPGTQQEQQAYDIWGFYPNNYYAGNLYMQAIRSNDCWSIDIEVAADGTKTF